MADPVVTLTNGIPTAGSGNITTLGQTLLDGANATIGITTGAAVTTSIAGTIQGYLRGIVSLLVSGITVLSHNVTNAGTFAVQVSSTVSTAVTNAGTFAVQATLQAGANLVGIFKIGDGTNTLALMAASTGAPAATVVALPVTIRDMLAPGSAVSASSAPVVIASDQAAVAIKHVAAATGGATNLHFFSVTGTPTATAIKSSAGTLYGVQAVNTGAAIVYLKIYNTAVGSVTVGTTVPLMTIPIPTVATTGAGIVVPFPVGVVFGTAMSWALTNVAADNDATAVAVGVTLNIQFA